VLNTTLLTKAMLTSSSALTASVCALNTCTDYMQR
jgi:hypothetical protein